MRKFLLILALISFSASAAPMYKCEIDGKTVYKDYPCPGGKEMKVFAGPTSSDQASARERSKKEKSIEQKLAQQKLKHADKEEKERQRAAKKSEAKDKKCAKLQQRATWAEQDAAKAAGKKAEKSQTKSRRTTEKYVLECKR